MFQNITLIGTTGRLALQLRQDGQEADPAGRFLGGCRVGGGALARWPPSASHTARADFPHAAFTKTQVFRDAKEGMNPTRWSINEWTFLAPVRLIQSTSLLGHGRTGFSLKELFRPPISLLIWFPFSS